MPLPAGRRCPLPVQVVDDLRHKVQDLEAVVLGQEAGNWPIGICHKKVLKDGPIAPSAESGDGLRRKRSVNTESGDFRCTGLQQCGSTFCKST